MGTDISTLYSIAFVQTVDDSRTESAGRRIRATSPHILRPPPADVTRAESDLSGGEDFEICGLALRLFQQFELCGGVLPLGGGGVQPVHNASQFAVEGGGLAGFGVGLWSLQLGREFRLA